MPINTNGWTIYAPENTSMEELIEAFESNEDLWSKAKGPVGLKGLGPRGWVLRHEPNHIVYTKGRNMELIKQRNKEWRTEIVVCQCGRAVARGGPAGHRKTSIHLAALSAQTP